MTVKELKSQMNAAESSGPNRKVLIKVKKPDGSYNVCEIESVVYGNFNGLFFNDVEVKDIPNCVVLNASEVPAELNCQA